MNEIEDPIDALNRELIVAKQGGNKTLVSNIEYAIELIENHRAKQTDNTTKN